MECLQDHEEEEAEGFIQIWSSLAVENYVLQSMWQLLGWTVRAVQT